MPQRSRSADRTNSPEGDLRQRALHAIATKPGIHLRELARVLEVSLNGVIHHLRVLEDQGAVIGISDGHYRRYFSRDLVLPAESRRLFEEDRKLLAECRRSMSLAIVLNLAVEGRLRHGELRKRVRRSKSTTSYHLARLVASGHVRIVRESSTEGYELVNRTRVVALLVTFSETLRDRVDAFADLWSSLASSDA